VKGFAAQEAEVFETVAKARAGLAGAVSGGNVTEMANANQQLTGALGRLLAISENYPQLKSDQNFLRLQDELTGTENRIAVERKRYNDDVKTLNTYRRTVFGRFIASLAGVNEAQYYEVPQTEQEAPKVKF
jgi:LemA protein